MKFDPVFTGQLKRDLKKMLAGGKEDKEFIGIARKLIDGEKLDPKHRDHKLVGNYAGRRKCHIAHRARLVAHLQDRRSAQYL
jgi:mRNA interferase YafQ